MLNNLKLDDRLRTRIYSNLQRLEIRESRIKNTKHAAVAITLVNCECEAGLDGLAFDAANRDQAAILLTTRSLNLNHHAGQRSFPGGRLDGGETVEQAALREMEEEVGLKLGPECILGRLDDYVSRSGFVISPVVIWGGSQLALSANPDEVAAIHHLPVAELLRSDAPILESIPESEHPVLKMPVGQGWVAAPTAAIAYQFREVAILGLQTRVAHFEQPYFAWQ